MTRDNLRARLEDADIELSMEKKLEEYEDLISNWNISDIETFKSKDGARTVVFEVRRRINLLRRLAERVGKMKIAKRAEKLLDSLL